MKKIKFSLMGLLLLGFLVPLYSKAAILPSNLLQSALYYSDYSSNLFNGKYDTTTSTYYICDIQSAYCGLGNALFKIGYDSTLGVYHICEGSVGYCGISTDIFVIQDGYICPGNYSYCGAGNSLGVHSALIPIESMVSILEGNTSSVTKNISKMNFSNGIYYICDSSVATCGNVSDFMQIKYDSSNATYYVCDGDTVTCGSISDFMQIKYDSSNATYYVCDGDTVTCGNISDFMQIKYDSSNATYYVCGGNTVTCGSISDYLQIKKDEETYYTCNGNTVSCFVSTAVYQTIAEGSSKYTNNNNSNGNSVIVSEESWNMLNEKYDSARNLIEKGDYDGAIKLLDEILSYEGTIVWGDNYELAKKVRNIVENAKNQKGQTTNVNSNSNMSSIDVPYKEYTNRFSEMEDAITWMYENGFTRYDNRSNFMAFDPITREQASKFFVEFAAKLYGKDRGTISSYNIFSDMNKVNPTLKDHVIYANNMGLFKGSNGKFMPNKNLTQAQAIAVVMRIVEGYKDESGTIPYYNPNDNFKECYGWYSAYLGSAVNYGLNKRGDYNNFNSLDSTDISRGKVALLLYEMAMYKSNNK